MSEPAERPEAQGALEIADSAVDDALNAVLAASLRPVCVGLALFYALLTGWYLTQLTGSAQLSMSGSTALLSIGLLVGAVWFERNRLPNWLAHPAAASRTTTAIGGTSSDVTARTPPRPPRRRWPI